MIGPRSYEIELCGLCGIVMPQSIGTSKIVANGLCAHRSTIVVTVAETDRRKGRRAR